MFKTLKYHPLFPGRFSSLNDTRAFLCPFFSWYNENHRHSGIGLMTPEMVHSGRAQEIYEQRNRVLRAAHKAHPERFVNQVPSPPPLPQAAWINRPSHVASDTTEDNQLESFLDDAFDGGWKEGITEHEVLMMSV